MTEPNTYIGKKGILRILVDPRKSLTAKGLKSQARIVIVGDGSIPISDVASYKLKSARDLTDLESDTYKGKTLEPEVSEDGKRGQFFVESFNPGQWSRARIQLYNKKSEILADFVDCLHYNLPDWSEISRDSMVDWAGFGMSWGTGFGGP